MRRDSISQVASEIPFDNTTGRGFTSEDCQTTIEEIRDHTVYTSSSTAISAAGTLSLTSSSNNLQYLTGSGAGYSVVLPNATTIPVGSLYQIINTTNETVDIKDGSSALLFTLSQNSIGYLYLQLNGTSAGTWVYFQVLASSTSSGIINYNITSTTPFTTSSTTDVVITGFTVTPQAGTYCVWYNASVFYTTTPIAHYWSIYKGGSKVADSARQQDTAHSNQTMVDSTMAVISCNGSAAVDVRVRRGTSGALTVNARTLILIRLGP